MKHFTFFLLFLTSFSFFGQQIDLQKYKYIVVADKFDFVNEVDKYETSSLTKFLFEKTNFEVFLSNENFPSDLQNNRCLALFVSVIDDSSMFTTKNAIEIKDCFGKKLFTSNFGTSKFKEYKKAYHETIREAFNTLENFEYSFNPTATTTNINAEADAIITVKTDNTAVVTAPIIVDASAESLQTNVDENTIDVLYAQPKTNGFQLVNTTPEVIFIILKTNVKDVFIINNKNGIIYKNDAFWIAEFYENNQLIQKKYQVKF